MRTTYIFANRMRYERVAYHRHYDPTRHRFVILLDAEFDERFPSEHRELFDVVKRLDRFDADTLAPIMAAEIAMAGSADQVRLISWDEELLLPCGALRRRFGLSGPDDRRLLPFRDKLVMKARLKAAGIRTPLFAAVDGDAIAAGPDAVRLTLDELRYPLIAKPVDGAGAVGACRIANDEDLAAFCRKNASSASIWDFEEEIRGRFHHCDTIVRDGNIVLSEVGAYLGSGLEFTEGRVHGSVTLPEANSLRTRILDFNKDILKALDAPDGCTHLELFHTPADELVFIEVAARPAGAEIIPAYARGIGIDLVEQLMRAELGLPADFSVRQRRGSGWAYFPKIRGRVMKLVAPPLQSRDLHLEWKTAPGALLDSSLSCYDRAGSILFADEDFSRVWADYELLENFSALQVKGGE